MMSFIPEGWNWYCNVFIALTHRHDVIYSRELKSTLHSLSHQVDQTKGELKEEIEKLAEDIKHLDEVATRSNFLR